jgi:hypothetical protein
MSNILTGISSSVVVATGAGTLEKVSVINTLSSSVSTRFHDTTSVATANDSNMIAKVPGGASSDGLIKDVFMPFVNGLVAVVGTGPGAQTVAVSYS